MLIVVMAAAQIIAKPKRLLAMTTYGEESQNLIVCRSSTNRPNSPKKNKPLTTTKPTIKYPINKIPDGPFIICAFPGVRTGES